MPRWSRRRWRSRSSSRSTASTTRSTMQSASAADGSYTLTVTFALGTDPDINTVNVQNRAQLATPLLPQEVQRQGLVDPQAVGGAAAGHHALFAEEHLRRAVISTTTPPSTSSTRWRASAASARRACSAPLDYSHAAVARHRPADRLQPHADRRGRRRSRARTCRRRSAASARAPIAAGPAVPAHHQDPGPADPARRSSTTSSSAPIPTARCVRVKDVARVDLGAKSQERYSRFNGAPAAAIGIYPVARRQRRRRRAAMSARHGRAEAALPRRPRIPGVLGHHGLRHHDHRRGRSTRWSWPSCWWRSSSSCSSASCAPRSSRWSPCRCRSSAPSPSCCDRLLGQHRLAAGPGAGHRHRGRRRHRGRSRTSSA